MLNHGNQLGTENLFAVSDTAALTDIDKGVVEEVFFYNLPTERALRSFIPTYFRATSLFSGASKILCEQMPPIVSKHSLSPAPT